MEAETDGELVRRIARGEGTRDAERELCRRFAERARNYGLRHLRDRDRASDLAQAVLVVLIEAARAGKIEDVDHVDRFVLGTCRNVALRVRETERRARPATDAELDVASFVPAFEAVDVSALMRCLAALDLRARAVVQESFMEEKSADEIAAALQTTAGNVRVIRHRSMGQLRECLEGAR